MLIKNIIKKMRRMKDRELKVLYKDLIDDKYKEDLEVTIKEEMKDQFKKHMRRG